MTIEIDDYRDDAADRAAYERLSAARLPGEPVRHRDDAPGRPLLRRVVRDGAELAGYLDCGVIGEVDDPGRFHLWVVVAPDHARQGLGSALLALARAFARQHGMVELVTGVAEDDAAAVGWLRRHGFADEGGLETWDRPARTPAGSPAETPAGNSARTPAANPMETPAGNPAGAAGWRVAPLDRDDPAQVDEFADLAVRTLNAVVLPGGARLNETQESVRAQFAGADGPTVLVAAGPGGLAGWAALAPPEQGTAYLLVALADAGQPEREVYAALGAELNRLADADAVAISATVVPESERELIAAMADLGYHKASGRLVCVGPVDAPAPAATASTATTVAAATPTTGAIPVPGPAAEPLAVRAER